MSSMDRIWTNRVEAGTKTLEDARKVGREEAVKTLMREDVEAGRNGMTPERYEEITGEPYNTEEGGEVDLESMTVAELKEYAAERGISLSGLTRKADIIAAIRAAQ